MIHLSYIKWNISKYEIMCIQCQGSCTVKENLNNIVKCPLCNGTGVILKNTVASILGKNNEYIYDVRS